MKFKIYFTLPNGEPDEVVLTGTIEEISEKAKAEIAKRNATDPWSEMIEE